MSVRTQSRPSSATDAARPRLDAEALQLVEKQIEAEIRRLRRTVERLPEEDLQRGGDALDATSERLGYEAEQAARARFAGTLAEWIGTLRRLQENPDAFGYCETCGLSIHPARLEILPTARTCAAC